MFEARCMMPMASDWGSEWKSVRGRKIKNPKQFTLLI